VDLTKLSEISICSGYGGIGEGLKLLGVNIVFTIHVEIETFACWNLVQKIKNKFMGNGIVWNNLKTFSGKKLRGKIDILSGGFPCQPFSCAGKRQATEDPRHLYPDIGRIISECQPRIVFLENVEGIISAKTGDGTPVLLYVLRDLEERGYTASWGIFSAEEVGAPHRRKRVFILAYSSSEGLEGGLLNEIQRNRQLQYVQPCRCGRNQWPARPGQQQYEWEPPRVC